MPSVIPTMEEPFPIFSLAHRFLLYDPNTIAHVREKYNICGVLIGGLPQAPQQNVFLGVPLELMPEEARVLVEKKVAYIEDDVKMHKRAFQPGSDATDQDNTGSAGGSLDAEERRAYQASLRRQGQAVADQSNKKTEDRRTAALNKLNVASGDWNDLPEDMLRPSSNAGSRSTSRGPKRKPRAIPSAPVPALPNGHAAAASEDDLLFGSSSTPVPDLPRVSRPPSSVGSNGGVHPYAVTPTTSFPPLQSSRPPPPPSSSKALSVEQDASQIDTPTSYPLFRDLHSKGYFLAPGLRFGCQYMAYPGDPLRFHSHFLCNGMEWDQDFDLLSLVGGGRLGTGVKKGFLIGGRDESLAEGTDPDETGVSDVRTFCIEWAGM